MADWKNVKVRGDLHRMVAERAVADRRSVSQMADVLLTQALQSRVPTTQIEPVLKQEADSRVGRALARGMREPIEGQTTVDEMPASCPQCAGELLPYCLDDDVGGGEMTVRCEDCGFIREPSDG